MPYKVHFTEAAAATRDKYTKSRRAAWEKALDMLAMDPHQTPSISVGLSEDERHIALTDLVSADYAVLHRARLIIITSINEDVTYLVPEEHKKT